MEQWQKAVQRIIDEIDLCIKSKSDEVVTLKPSQGSWGILNSTSPESSGSFPA